MKSYEQGKGLKPSKKRKNINDNLSYIFPSTGWCCTPPSSVTNTPPDCDGDFTVGSGYSIQSPDPNPWPDMEWTGEDLCCAINPNGGGCVDNDCSADYICDDVYQCAGGGYINYSDCSLFDGDLDGSESCTPGGSGPVNENCGACCWVNNSGNYYSGNLAASSCDLKPGSCDGHGCHAGTGSYAYSDNFCECDDFGQIVCYDPCSNFNCNDYCSGGVLHYNGYCEFFEPGNEEGYSEGPSCLYDEETCDFGCNINTGVCDDCLDSYSWQCYYEDICPGEFLWDHTCSCGDGPEDECGVCGGDGSRCCQTKCEYLEFRGDDGVWRKLSSYKNTYGNSHLSPSSINNSTDAGTCGFNFNNGTGLSGVNDIRAVCTGYQGNVTMCDQSSGSTVCDWPGDFANFGYETGCEACDFCMGSYSGGYSEPYPTDQGQDFGCAYYNTSGNWWMQGCNYPCDGTYHYSNNGVDNTSCRCNWTWESAGF